MIKVTATIFVLVTTGILVVELARDVGVGSSILLAVICGCGAALGSSIGISLSKKTENTAHDDSGK
jgi:hypothetical protein